MATLNVQLIIEVLEGLVNYTELNLAKFDEAIDVLENIKSTLDADNEEDIDKIDEIQDYFQYLLTMEEPLIDEIHEEILHMIDYLQE